MIIVFIIIPSIVVIFSDGQFRGPQFAFDAGGCLDTVLTEQPVMHWQIHITGL